MNMGVEEEGRIPYFIYSARGRYLSLELCVCSITILANPNAQITYKVDGVAVTPVNGSITFASKGQHFLQIEIIETPERSWEIEYKLNVD